MQNLAANISSHLALRAQSGNNWIVTFNNLKGKLISFHISGPGYSSLTMNGCDLNEVPFFESLLDLNLTSDLNKRNSCIPSIAKGRRENSRFTISFKELFKTASHILSSQESDQA